MNESQERNYRRLFIANIFFVFADGLIGALAYIQLIDIQQGSAKEVVNLIFIVGIMQAVASYVCGKFSDKLGRKLFLIIGELLMLAVIVGYFYAEHFSSVHIYVLQSIVGISRVVYKTAERSIIADITEGSEIRGKRIGLYDGVEVLCASVALLIGVYLGMPLVIVATGTLMGVLSIGITTRIKEK